MLPRSPLRNASCTVLPIVAIVGMWAGAAAADPAAEACLAEAIYHEARGNGDDGATAVAHVVLNRRKHVDFPDTICGVIGDDCQFSYRCDGRSLMMNDATERARAERVAAAAISGDTSDPTGGALFFHAAGIDPDWFATRTRTGTIGNNVFYR